jgi:hypothetical protein
VIVNHVIADYLMFLPLHIARVLAQHRDEAARYFMHAERRAAAEMLGDAQATPRATAHLRNIEAARVAVEQRLAEADKSWGLVSVAEERHRREIFQEQEHEEWFLKQGIHDSLMNISSF